MSMEGSGPATRMSIARKRVTAAASATLPGCGPALPAAVQAAGNSTRSGDRARAEPASEDVGGTEQHARFGSSSPFGEGGNPSGGCRALEGAATSNSARTGDQVRRLERPRPGRDRRRSAGRRRGAGGVRSPSAAARLAGEAGPEARPGGHRRRGARRRSAFGGRGARRGTRRGWRPSRGGQASQALRPQSAPANARRRVLRLQGQPVRLRPSPRSALCVRGAAAG